MRRDVEVDAAVAVGDGEPRLGTEERRVLCPDLEVRLDDDVGSPARLVRVTVADAHVAHEVAAGMHGTAVAGEGELGVHDGLQFLVHHDDLVEGATGDLGMVGGDDGHGLALVADLVEGEHGLIGDLHAVRLLAGDVLVGEHRGHTRDRQRPRRVQAEDAGAWEGAAQRGAPQRAGQMEVGGVGEVAGDLERAVGPRRRIPDAAGLAGARCRACGLDRGHRFTMSRVRASERQRASGHQRPAWPGNAMDVMRVSALLVPGPRPGRGGWRCAGGRPARRRRGHARPWRRRSPGARRARHACCAWRATA